MADMIAICDKETVFVQILASFLRKKYSPGVKIQAFDDVEALIQVAKEKEIQLCLIGEGLTDSFQLQILLEKSSHLIYLSNKKRKDMVFKYQSVEHVVGDLLELCAENRIPFLEEKKWMSCCPKIQIKAFYAPARHMLQSTIALTMGQIMAKEKKVLYLNLEPFSGFEYLLKKTYAHDLMDILFFMKEDKENFRLRMESMLE